MASYARSFDAEPANTGLLEPPRELRAPGHRPRRGRGGPPRWEDGGGSGDDGGDRGDGSDPPPEEGGPFDAAQIRFALVLGAVATIFLVFLCTALALRISARELSAGAMTPVRLWVVTSVLVISSVTMSAAVRAARAGRATSARTWLRATLALGLTFLGLQAVLWRHLLARGMVEESRTYATVFFGLTGVHAAHVGAGLAYQAAGLWKLRHGKLPGRGELSLPRCGIYWHVMGVLWLVMLTLIYLPG